MPPRLSTASQPTAVFFSSVPILFYPLPTPTTAQPRPTTHRSRCTRLVASTSTHPDLSIPSFHAASGPAGSRIQFVGGVRARRRCAPCLSPPRHCCPRSLVSCRRRYSVGGPGGRCCRARFLALLSSAVDGVRVLWPLLRMAGLWKW